MRQTTRSPRVLHVLTTAQRRGAETYAVALDGALRDTGIDSRAVALRGAPHGAPALEVASLDAGDRSSAQQLRSLRAELKRADVAVAHGSRTMAACAMATTGLRTPFVYRVIGETSHWAPDPLRRVRVGLLLHRSAAVVTYYEQASQEIRRRYRLAPSRVHTIAKGIALGEGGLPDDDDRISARRELGLDDTPLVLALGALAPEKDLAVAIRAVHDLGNTTLALVGDGPEQAALVALAARLGAKVLIPGATSEPLRWLLAADAVVLTSRTEGVPGALLEASAVGTPCVAVDVGGVRQVIDDGVTGRVVTGRDPTDVAAALCDVLVRRHELGAAAHAHTASHADLALIADRWADLLTDIAR